MTYIHVAELRWRGEPIEDPIGWAKERKEKMVIIKFMRRALHESQMIESISYEAIPESFWDYMRFGSNEIGTKVGEFEP